LVWFNVFFSGHDLIINLKWVLKLPSTSNIE
jgi:hypothetical protein